MDSFEIDKLISQNFKLKNQVKQQRTSIKCLQNDLQTVKNVLKQQKNQIQLKGNQIKKLKKKIDQDERQKQRVQSRYTAVLRQLEQELQDYKNKYSKLQNKIQPLLDADSVRLKVLNEVEGNHFMQLNNVKNKYQLLKDENLKLKRQIEYLKYSLQNQKINYTQQLRRLKNNKNSQSARDSFNNISMNIWKEMEQKIKNSYQNARKQAEYYKDKYFQSQRKYQIKIQQNRHMV